MRQAGSRNPLSDSSAWLSQLPDGRQLATVAALLRGAAGGFTDAADETVTGVPGRPLDQAAMTRLLADPAARRRLAAAVRLAATPERPRRRPWRLAGVGMAAAAALLIWTPWTARDGDEHRAVLARGEIEILETTPTPAGLPRICWSRVLGASEYEVEITGSEGDPVYRATTGDTVLVIADATLHPAEAYFVRVRARMDVGRWVASPFQPLVVQP